MKPISAFMLLGALGLVLTTTFSQEDDKNSARVNVAQIAGNELFVLKKCADCHTLAAEAEGKRTPVTNMRDQAWFAQHVQKESPIVLRKEKSKRKQRRVLKAEIRALEEFLYHSTPETRKQIASLPENVARGAYLVYQNNCTNCHAINGFGKDIAPDLSQVGKKRKRDWLIANLKDPKQFAPETLMPPFDHLPEEDLERIADYLSTLK